MLHKKKKNQIFTNPIIISAPWRSRRGKNLRIEMPLLLSSPPTVAIAVSTSSAAPSAVRINHLYCSQSRRLYRHLPVSLPPPLLSPSIISFVPLIFRCLVLGQDGASLPCVRTSFSFAGRGAIRPMATAEPDTQTQTSILSTGANSDSFRFFLNIEKNGSCLMIKLPSLWFISFFFFFW